MRERMREVFREGGEKNRNKIGRWRWSKGRNKREIERREGEILHQDSMLSLRCGSHTLAVSK